MKKAIVSKASLAGIGAFAMLAASVQVGMWDQLDTRLTEFLQAFASAPLDYFFSVFSYLGSPEITGLGFLSLGFWLWKRHGPAAVIFLFFVLGTITLIEIIGKHGVFNPGPYDIYERQINIFGFKKSVGGAVDTPYSFPSGHTLRFVFLMLALDKLLSGKRLFKVLCWLLLGLMIVNRVYVGDHWASDVIGGVILGGLGHRWLWSSPFTAEKASV